MLSRQWVDRRGFLETARKPGATVSVVTDTRVVPRVSGTSVVMQPAILLHYVLSFEEGGAQQKRIFEEFIDDSGGKVTIHGSLLEDLDKDEGIRARLRVLDRTMALPSR
jgi:hypothetical protein